MSRSRAWTKTAAIGKTVLPRSVREPIERKLGERNERRLRIDLSFASVIRSAPEEDLLDRAKLERVLTHVGLNDELDEFPPDLQTFGGFGLRLWQFPNQFAPYLLELAGREIRRYLEIGVRHGGSFITTVEYLSRFTTLEEAVAVDIDPLVALLPYPLEQPAVKLMQADTQSQTFRDWVRRHGPFDLAFVDGLHTLEGSRHDFESVREHARLIAVHDIVNHLVPDVQRTWQDVKEAYSSDFEFREFVEQYPHTDGPDGRGMGIGLAIRRS
jgi:hypothetical protein